MRSGGSSRIRVLVVVISLLFPLVAQAALTMTLYDNFDDGDFTGWNTTGWSGGPSTPPDIVSSPQGYALRGIGSGYGQDPGLDVALSLPFVVSNVGPLKVEMRAKSGSQWPNADLVWLVNGGDRYVFADYGEGNQMTWFATIIDNTYDWAVDRRYSVDATPWHDFAWERDSAGWWSLSIDGQEVWHNFVYENRLTAFAWIGLQPLRDQSEIEWVRITATVVPVPVPGAILLGGIGAGLTGWLRRRHTL